MKKNMTRTGIRLALFSIGLAIFPMLTGCYSVFSGGTGGTIVDSESTSSPKAGIANVEVYAYTSESERDSDFESWTNGTQEQAFSPEAFYYGHTTSDSSGNWSISKIVWKEKSFETDFGKDADYTKIYLIFYHEDYGCTKDETIIMSDSTSDCTYTELTSIRKTTNLTLNFVDVSDDSTTENSLYVKILVPQTTEKNSSAKPKIYSQTITGSGSVPLSYPRWQSASDKTAGIETEPEILVAYVQSSDEIDWLGCYNADNEASDYSFRLNAADYSDYSEPFRPDEKATIISKKIKNSSYSINLYGKSTKFSYPTFSGYYGDSNSAESDGVHIILAGQDSDGNYTKILGDAYTGFENRGNNGDVTHGLFSGLGGNSFFWTDEVYTDKWAATSVCFKTENEEILKIIEIVSAHNSYSNLQL